MLNIAIGWRHFAVLMSSSMLIGCVAIGPARVVSFDNKHDTKRVESALFLIPANDQDKKNWEKLYANKPEDLDHSAPDEIWVADQCKAVKPADHLALQSIEGFAIGLVVDWVLGQVARSIQAEVDRYTTVYQATATNPFYATNANQLVQPPEPSVVCFRFVHGERTEKGGFQPWVDLVGQLQTKGYALQVKPLRLYFKRGTYENWEKYKTKVGIAASLSFSGVWQERNQGKQATVLNHVFLSTSRNFSSAKQPPKYIEYFRKKDNASEPYPLLALPPASIDWNNNLIAPEPFAFTVSIGEVAAPPPALKRLHEFFKSKKDDIGTLLKDAAEKALDKGDQQ